MRLILTAFIFLLIISECLASSNSEESSNRYRHSIYSVSEKTFQNKDVISLETEWEFYWNKAYTPDSFNHQVITPLFTKVPETWRNLQIANDYLPALGTGTYRLTLQNIDNLRDLEIIFYSISTTYKIWIDEKEVLSIGKTPFGEVNSKIMGRSRDLLKIPFDKEYLEIIVQVSNQENNKGGIVWSPLLGRKGMLSRQEYARRDIEMMQIGCLVVMIIFNLFLFLQMKKQAYLYIGLLCVIVLLRATLVYDGSLLLYQIFPSITASIGKKIEYSMVYLTIFLLPLYVKSLFNIDKYNKVVYFLIVSSLILILIVLIYPPYIFGFTLNVFHVLMLIGFGIVFMILAEALKKNFSGSKIVFWGAFIAFFFVFFEIFRTSDWRFLNFTFEGPNLVNTGVVIFLFFQTLATSRKFVGALKENEVLSKTLEEKVEKRTEELSKANIIKDKMISIISHDIKSPLNSLKSVIHLMNLDAITKEEQKVLFQNLNIGLSTTLSMLEDVLSWVSSQMNKDNEHHKQESFNITELIEEYKSLYQNPANLKDIKINSDFKKKVNVYANKNSIKVVVRNLINNAIKFTPSQGSINLCYLEEDEKYLTVIIQDSGIGIPDEIKDKIFEITSEKCRTGTANEKGTGLGLILCKDLVEQNGGKIWIEDNTDVGTTIMFSLKKYNFKDTSPRQDELELQRTH
jgi:signal transduction histidine kinase